MPNCRPMGTKHFGIGRTPCTFLPSLQEPLHTRDAVIKNMKEKHGNFSNTLNFCIIGRKSTCLNQVVCISLEEPKFFKFG